MAGSVPKKGELCDMCNTTELKGVPGPVGSCCEDKFRQAIAEYKAKQAIKNKTVPF